jgi:ferredoxin
MTWANARRVVQGLFLALFLIVLIRTTLIGEDDTAPLATFFLDIDPLAFLATWIASGSVLPGMFLALIKRPPAHLIRTGTWNQWQKSKYLLLIGLLAAALTGLHLAGIFDPISLLYRTVATSIYPALVWASHQLFTWLYFADPGIGPVRVTLISEPIYSFLRAWVLTPQPVAYVGGVLIGAFFIGQCEQCNMCVAYCPGACDPHLAGRWKKEECYFCFTCREQCPDGAISFHWKWGGKSREIIPPLTPGQAPKPAVLSNVTEA